MTKKHMTVVTLMIILSIILIIFGIFLNIIKINKLNDKIKQQETIIQELNGRNKQLIDDAEILYNKYFYEKLQAEYWYYYNVDDAY